MPAGRSLVSGRKSGALRKGEAGTGPPGKKASAGLVLTEGGRAIQELGNPTAPEMGGRKGFRGMHPFAALQGMWWELASGPRRFSRWCPRSTRSGTCCGTRWILGCGTGSLERGKLWGFPGGGDGVEWKE